MQLADRVIVVTGGAQGIGRALCRRFAEEQPRAVVVVDVDNPRACQVAEAIGGRALVCDVSRAQDVQRVVETVEREFGRVDLFCANAGIGLAGGCELPDEAWRRVLDVNFMAHVYAVRAALPRMLQRGQGAFLHTASAAGLLTDMSSAPYSVSKHAVISLAEWLSINYAGQGIHFSCLCPQGVRTQLLDSSQGPVADMLRESALTPEQVADATIEGLRREQFLILPHPHVHDYYRRRAEDTDRWLAGMRRLLAERTARPGGESE